MSFPFFDGLSFADFAWDEKVSDYLSGFTSANSANRFYEQNMALQQKYNERNMELQQDYNEKNMALTDDYQRRLISDSPALQVAALRSAGLNPLLAVDNGISSAQTAVKSSNPTSAPPSASMPNVQPRISDLVDGISSAASLGSTVADIVLKGAQTQAAKASSAESAARTIKTMKESDSIDPELEKDLKRYPGKFGHDAVALQNGVVKPVFNIINSAWSATKDFVVEDIKKTGRQLDYIGDRATDGAKRLKARILNAPDYKFNHPTP